MSLSWQMHRNLKGWGLLQVGVGDRQDKSPRSKRTSSLGGICADSRERSFVFQSSQSEARERLTGRRSGANSCREGRLRYAWTLYSSHQGFWKLGRSSVDVTLRMVDDGKRSLGGSPSLLVANILGTRSPHTHIHTRTHLRGGV